MKLAGDSDWKAWMGHHQHHHGQARAVLSVYGCWRSGVCVAVQKTWDHHGVGVGSRRVILEVMQTLLHHQRLEG